MIFKFYHIYSISLFYGGCYGFHVKYTDVIWTNLNFILPLARLQTLDWCSPYCDWLSKDK